IRGELLEDIAWDHPKAFLCQELLLNWYRNRNSERWKGEELRKQNVILKDTRSHLQITEKPVFHFSDQIAWLYKYDVRISPDKIEKILQLESIELIEDLEKIVIDSIVRFDYYCEQLEKD